MSSSPPSPPAPPPRRRTTRRSVLIADAAAKWIIRSGGLLVIAAVTLIGVFLVAEVLPLFQPARVSAPVSNPAPGLEGADILFAETDEYLAIAAVVTGDGNLHVHHVADGRRILTRRIIPEGKTITAHARQLTGGHTAFGFSDGTFSLGTIRFGAEFLPEAKVTGPAAALTLGQTAVHGEGVAVRTPIGQIRVSRVEVELGAPSEAQGPPSPVVAIDYRVSEKPVRRISAVLRRTGDLNVGDVSETEDLVSGEKRTTLTARKVAFEHRSEPPKFVLLQESGTEMFVGWVDGSVRRYDLRGLLDGRPGATGRMIETFNAAADGAKLAVLRFQLGDQSVVAADDRGGLSVWFTVRPPEHEFRLWTAGVADFYAERGGADKAIRAWFQRPTADRTSDFRRFTEWVKKKTPRTRLMQDWLRAGGEWEAFLRWSAAPDAAGLARRLDLVDQYLAESKRGPQEFAEIVRAEGPERFADWLNDSAGEGPAFRAWMIARGAEVRLSTDGRRTLEARRFAAPASAITASACSSRDKGLLTGAADGRITVWNTTSGVAAAELNAGAAVAALQISPKADAVFAFDKSGRMHLWRIENAHGEITLGTILGKTWYEGYPEAEHVWQSSAGTDSFERKYGLVALIFGTLKGTFYAMLFSLPIAVLAAIYTSEFLHPKVRAVVKPTMEVMASLPSVVLGFIAALVAAPWIETRVVGVLLVVVLVPTVCLLGGYLWQTIPRKGLTAMGRAWFFAAALVAAAGGIALRQSGCGDGWAILGALPATCWWAARGHGPLLPLGALVLLGGLVSLELGDVLEHRLMDGDFRAWLEGRIGTGTPLWTLLLLPAVAFVVIRAAVPRLNAALAAAAAGRSAWFPAVGELGKFVAVTALCVAGSAAIGSLLTAAGWDLRGALVGTYVQRNSLVVGFFMGFAVIPIMYTISEDALNAVPEGLRSASLGCGATRWQTALRVVLPTALSGVFSAAMIGLGRAVGETMIVVMATGNTPILDLNLFNGFKALSATIAIELPESVKDSTLYRMLFLSGLVLFAVTFVINTVAEVIRLRFRRRAFQL